MLKGKKFMMLFIDPKTVIGSDFSRNNSRFLKKKKWKNFTRSKRKK